MTDSPDQMPAATGRGHLRATYADLAALTTDIPGAPAPAPRVPPAGARRRPLARAAAGSGGCLVIAFGADSSSTSPIRAPLPALSPKP